MLMKLNRASSRVNKSQGHIQMKREPTNGAESSEMFILLQKCCICPYIYNTFYGNVSTILYKYRVLTLSLIDSLFFVCFSPLDQYFLSNP